MHQATRSADDHDRLPAFRIQRLTKTYRMGETQIHALRGVDLDIHEREIVVLLGPSGGGKSTLLNILGGLDRPTSGRVWFRKEELTILTDRQLTSFRRRHVGFIFQFYNLIPSLTARENIALVTDIATDPLDPVAALELVGLGDRIDHFPAQLSGGEQQRVAVARAVAKRPQVLLCDEPTGALDSAAGVRVLEAIAAVNSELGTTTVLITHNVAIAQIADRVVRIADGCVARIEAHATRLSPGEVTW